MLAVNARVGVLSGIVGRQDKGQDNVMCHIASINLLEAQRRWTAQPGARHGDPWVTERLRAGRSFHGGQSAGKCTLTVAVRLVVFSIYNYCLIDHPLLTGLTGRSRFFPGIRCRPTKEKPKVAVKFREINARAHRRRENEFVTQDAR